MSNQTGGERVPGNRVHEDSSWTLTIAYDQEIDVGMRVVQGSDFYEVTDVNTGRSFATGKRASLRRLA